jgi:alkyl hydroperoxide reductase subunit AhpC
LERWLLLVFYPQDFSLICPTELSALSECYDELRDLNADVLAISTDSIESHERWIGTDRTMGGLGPVRFPLASDPTGEVSRAYNVYAEAQHLALRGLFIVDPNSVLQYQVVHNLSTGRSINEILRVLQALQVGGLCAENWSPDQLVIDAATELGPGMVISHFRIEETIGEGAFATVYRAFDRDLERDVALKILKPLDERAADIREEARAAAGLNHPNICTVHGVEDSLGTSMIVMEYLVGEPLSTLVREGPTSLEKTRDIGHQIASGMEAAHSSGVVHGDLKPANILLTPDGTVKILDFGLAGRRHVSEDGVATLTLETDRVGIIAGTPSFMSPEQADGQPATAASDVFSFGLILYELLTGERRYADDNVLEVLRKIRSIDPSTFADCLQEPFRAVVGRMLVHEPRSRTISMAEVSEVLS